MSDSQFTKIQLITIAIQILAIFIQVFCIFVSYYLGSKKDKQEYRLRIKENRYNNFYFPYIQLLFTFKAWNFTSYGYSFEALNKFRNIIENNAKYLDEKTLTLYRDFSNAYWYLADDTEHTHEQGPLHSHDVYDVVFFTIGYSILLEAQAIAHELGLPIITKPFLKTFAKNSQEYNNLVVPEPDFP